MGLFGRRVPKTCWVRSATDDPCGRPAAVEIMGVPFCERCAREQEEYAAIGDLTDPERARESGRLREASLAESLRRLRRERNSRTVPRNVPRRGQRA